MTVKDPFAPLSAKPASYDDWKHRRQSEGGSAGGKTHRGKGRAKWNSPPRHKRKKSKPEVSQ